MTHEPQEQADIELAHRREPRLGAPAGVYLLEGEFEVAAFGGAAAARLEARGALLVAGLHFVGLTARIAVTGGLHAGSAATLTPFPTKPSGSRIGGFLRRN